MNDIRIDWNTITICVMEEDIAPEDKIKKDAESGNWIESRIGRRCLFITPKEDKSIIKKKMKIAAQEANDVINGGVSGFEWLIKENDAIQQVKLTLLDLKRSIEKITGISVGK